jgi:septum formation protein
MMQQAGMDVRVVETDIDDALLRNPGVPAEHWVMAMAHLKARSAADAMLGLAPPPPSGCILGADTVCVVDGRMFGQPRDADDAAAMVRMMRDRWHHTLTGVCLIDLPWRTRLIWFDRARVRIGRVSDEQIESYVGSGQWRGKAGAYNLSERIEAGWPIEVIGDATTVMGLPMRRLLPLIQDRAD